MKKKIVRNKIDTYVYEMEKKIIVNRTKKLYNSKIIIEKNSKTKFFK